MKKPNYKFLNSILAVGMFFIFAGVVMAFAFSGTRSDFLGWIIPAAIFLAGLVDLYLCIAFSRTPFKLFVGLIFSLYGIFSLILVFKLFPADVAQLWPVYMILASISLFSAGRTTGRRFSLAYDFPALVLFVLGIFFLLFSFDVIKISFRRLSLFIWPLFLILSGAFLILLFVRRKSLLEILPEDVSNELNNEPNFTDTDEEDE